MHTSKPLSFNIHSFTFVETSTLMTIFHPYLVLFLVLFPMYHLCSYLLFYHIETGFSVLVWDRKSHALLVLLISVQHSSDVSLPYDYNILCRQSYSLASIRAILTYYFRESNIEFPAITHILSLITYYVLVDVCSTYHDLSSFPSLYDHGCTSRV